MKSGKKYAWGIAVLISIYAYYVYMAHSIMGHSTHEEIPTTLIQNYFLDIQL